MNMWCRIRKFILILAVLSGLSSPSFAQTEPSDFEISKNIDIFITLYKQLHLNYVDDLNSGQLMKTAIDAMLEELDPYTVYIPESEIEDYKFMTTGQYGGIGSLIQLRGNWVYISEPYEGFPADLAGLKAGDKILEINGKSAKNKTIDEVSTALKGQPGTDVIVLIERDSTQKPIEKVITRQEIKLGSVPYYGMVSDGIGYIDLTEFRQNAAKEVKDAFGAMESAGKLDGLIIDLRGNGGGLLNEAVSIVNIFVEKGQAVVTTMGKLKDKNHIHKTLNAAMDMDIPLVILVDGSSASASEIVAGAIQDLDRGVIIGQRTYGKGLVQNIIPLTYNSEMKVTVAKYYIPSGRCIQELDYSNKDPNGNASILPDSLCTPFNTKNGRVVYDRGGIEPDIQMIPKEYSNLSRSLVEKYIIFDFATHFCNQYASISPAKDFQITDEIYNDFLAFIKDRDYDYVTKSEAALADLKKNAEKENYFDAIRAEYDALQQKMMHDKQADLVKSKEEIKLLIKTYILPRYYYQKGRIEGVIGEDPEVIRAVEVLKNQDKYNSILAGPHK
jgi:carboxyl-terminal processing protease